MGTRVGGGIHFSDKSLVGVSRLLEDLHRLSEDKESADIIFVVGREETHIPAHKLILKSRCKSFGEDSGGQVCVIPGSAVSPGASHTTIRLSQYQPAIFRQVISYIYTGKVVMSDSGVFEMYGVAHDLGMEELCQHCEDHITGTMSPHNACTFFMAALNMEHRTGDSQVFAEEVEPTGAVPMELSLERYRYAALPNKFKDNAATAEDKRLQPRVSLKLFAGSQILINEKMTLQRVLNSWYGVGKQMWRLVYRASTHGYSADAFHRHCDGIAPTYTIVLGQHGEICGGFSDVPWSKTSMKGRYVASDKAFLFTLVNTQDLPPTKFPVVKKMFAICYHPDCGPIFGAGADLFIASNCQQNRDSYSNLSHSYDGESASCNTLMGDYNFTVIDYEVFTPK
ncbi:uncharacterized protein LOC143038603 isoform X2 [Oratosquilla oratoria]|uniref:uncharacterized protein LOC143038603 isoform X2 n=1 Tax=Oratosquilla oratoria TaxID=337810 RepID=UPI003F76B880